MGKKHSEGFICCGLDAPTAPVMTQPQTSALRPRADSITPMHPRRVPPPVLNPSRGAPGLPKLPPKESSHAIRGIATPFITAHIHPREPPGREARFLSYNISSSSHPGCRISTCRLPGSNEGVIGDNFQAGSSQGGEMLCRRLTRRQQIKAGWRRARSSPSHRLTSHRVSPHKTSMGRDARWEAVP